MDVSLLLAGTIALALGFAFANGVHDTAAVTATAVATRSMTARAALAVATGGNLLGALASTAVATTVGTRLLSAARPPTLDVLAAALAGAIAWTVLSWYASLPASASYALIGGLVGASVAAFGLDALRLRELAQLALVPALALPVVCLGLSFAILLAVARIARSTPLARTFAALRLGQIGTTGLVAFAHGLADAQKTMGVIALALVASGHVTTFSIPTWVVLASAAAMTAGTVAGGLEPLRRRGFRLHLLEPPPGFALQAATALGVLYASALGLPVSTGHALAGASIGAGSRGRLRALRISIALEIGLTVLAAALVSALVYLPLRLG